MKVKKAPNKKKDCLEKCQQVFRLNINTEDFIYKIKGRPVIWDCSVEWINIFIISNNMIQ